MSSWQLDALTRNGGFGRMSRTNTRAQRRSTQLLRKLRYARGPSSCRPFAGPQGKRLPDVWSGMVDVHPRCMARRAA